jgi:effector-binding domain-containing protein
VHVGPYEAMTETYQALVGWSEAEGLRLGEDMWEIYLSDPSTEPDPATWRTQVLWRVT